jgi:hypothetical protein
MAVRQKDVSREALSRLPKLDLRELREEWRFLYKTDASPHLSRELLIRAVAYRMQEVALGGLRPEPQRQLRQIAMELKHTGVATVRLRPQLKPGTRLIREWQGRTYEVATTAGALALQPVNSDKAAAALIATVTTRPLSSNGHRSDARMSPKVRFAIDSPLEEAVTSEPVSEPKFPVMQGKYREFHRFEPRSPRSGVETAIIISALRANSLRSGTGN